MSKLKTALNLEGLSEKIRQDLESPPTYLQGLLGRGTANSRTIEPKPKFVQSESEKVLDNGTNAQIIIGKDRPSQQLTSSWVRYGGSEELRTRLWTNVRI